MSRLALLALAVVPLILYSQTPINTATADQKETIIVNFTKNESGEIVLKIKGHRQPLELQINGAKFASLYEQDESANLTQAGFESAILAIDTKSGTLPSKVDTQAVIPPVTSAANPPMSTPF